MKYLSLIILIFAMKISWSYIHNPATVSEYTHIGIQEDLKSFITDYIKEQIPNSREIVFQKFWTKSLKKDRVKVTFLYSFVEDFEQETSTTTSIEGHAILKHQESENQEYDLWSLEQLNILNNKVEFQDGITIRANEDEQ